MSTNDIKEYNFFFGFKGQASNGRKIRPWHLSHVTDFSVSLDSKSVEIGIPTVPPEHAQIFDMSGPVREFNLSGLRFESEEIISNTDFIFKKISDPYTWNNPVGPPDNNCVSAGLSSMFSVIQASIPGFYFGIFSNIDSSNDPDDDLIETGNYNVALSGLSIKYLDVPGGISYDLKLIERRQMGNFDYSKLMADD